MATFDFQSPADLYVGHRRGRRNQSLRYLRFQSAAEAISYAIEWLTPDELAGAAIETGDVRLVGSAIRSVYDAAEFPLMHDLANQEHDQRLR
jgi:hypothetical protein